jgi:hypothetical protein
MALPSHFVRRQKKYSQSIRNVAISTEVQEMESSSRRSHALEMPASPEHNRAKYNRIVGAMVQEQNECTDEDIDLEKLEFHRECLQAIFGSWTRE